MPEHIGDLLGQSLRCRTVDGDAAQQPEKRSGRAAKQCVLADPAGLESQRPHAENAERQIKAAREKVTEGTSAVFLMTEDAVTDKVTEAIVSSGLEFELFYTNLSKEQEAELREDFG